MAQVFKWRLSPTVTFMLVVLFAEENGTHMVKGKFSVDRSCVIRRRQNKTELFSYYFRRNEGFDRFWEREQEDFLLQTIEC